MEASDLKQTWVSLLKEIRANKSLGRIQVQEEELLTIWHHTVPLGQRSSSSGGFCSKMTYNKNFMTEACSTFVSQHRKSRDWRHWILHMVCMKMRWDERWRERHVGLLWDAEKLQLKGESTLSLHNCRQSSLLPLYLLMVSCLPSVVC